MKKVFSANPEATINVECIMNDIDVAGRLSRDIFEEKSASVLERARAPLQKVAIAVLHHPLPHATCECQSSCRSAQYVHQYIHCMVQMVLCLGNSQSSLL